MARVLPFITSLPSARRFIAYKHYANYNKILMVEFGSRAQLVPDRRRGRAEDVLERGTTESKVLMGFGNAFPV